MHVHARIILRPPDHLPSPPPRSPPVLLRKPVHAGHAGRGGGVRRGLLPRDTGYYISIISAPDALLNTSPPRSLRESFGPTFGIVIYYRARPARSNFHRRTACNLIGEKLTSITSWLCVWVFQRIVILIYIFLFTIFSRATINS